MALHVLSLAISVRLSYQNKQHTRDHKMLPDDADDDKKTRPLVAGRLMKFSVCIAADVDQSYRIMQTISAGVLTRLTSKRIAARQK